MGLFAVLLECGFYGAVVFCLNMLFGLLIGVMLECVVMLLIVLLFPFLLCGLLFVGFGVRLLCLLFRALV